MAWILWHDLQIIPSGYGGSREWAVVGTAKNFEQCTEPQEKALADHLSRPKGKSDSASYIEKQFFKLAPGLSVLPRTGGRKSDILAGRTIATLDTREELRYSTEGGDILRSCAYPISGFVPHLFLALQRELRGGSCRDESYIRPLV